MDPFKTVVVGFKTSDFFMTEIDKRIGEDTQWKMRLQQSSRRLQGFSIATDFASGDPWMDGDSFGVKTLYDRWTITQQL